MDRETRQQIIDRFHSDQTFRDRVLKDANQAVKQEFGLDLPCPMRVVADGSSYRIEPIGGSENGDLSDEQLELVSGGKYSRGPVSQPPLPSTRFGRTNLPGPDGGT
jgi:hypothetical protein